MITGESRRTRFGTVVDTDILPKSMQVVAKPNYTKDISFGEKIIYYEKTGFI